MSEDDRRDEVFRGHWEECLQHFSVAFNSCIQKGSRGAAKAKKPMADFCGTTIDSVVRWFHGASLPVGTQFIKLMCFLDMNGYQVIELERMPKGQRGFLELIGFGFLSIEEAAEFLGYNSVSTLYQVLQGNHRPLEDKRNKMWSFWMEKKKELKQKKNEARNIYCLDISKKTRHSSRQRAEVKIMEGLLVLLEESDFEKLSDSDLLESADTILRLSGHLSGLNSRLMIMPDQREGGV